MAAIVNTKYGKVKGTTRTTEIGKVYSAYFAIPYAKQPVGELRFRDPEPLEPWVDELDATTEKPEAYQISAYHETGRKGIVTGTDSCLILNVYTPNAEGKLPVYVWIHGGALIMGSSSTDLYSPDYFVEKDVLVVTINYRLGVIGFLSFKDESLGIPGNAALKDQSMALRWVKENIEFFGGDPNNITVGGESAGGASVHFQMISPMSDGLFNRGIIQSGSAFSSWASLPDGESYEYEFARKLGWNGEGGDRGAFNVIAATEITKLLTSVFEFIAEQDLEKTVFGAIGFSPFLPRVEPYTSRLCFLPKPVVELGREAWSKDIEVIVGANKDEGIFYDGRFEQCSPLLEQSFKYLIPYHLRRTLNQHEQTAAASILKNVYFWKKDVNFKFGNKFNEVMGDLTFWHGIHRILLQRHFKGGKGKTYHYFLATSLDPCFALCQMFRDVFQCKHKNGTSHGEDLPLTWRDHLSKRPTPEDKIYSTQMKFLDSFVSFIRTGDPNCPSLEVKWKTIEQRSSEAEMFKCLKFSDEGAELVASPNGEKLLVWDSLYEQDDLI